MPTKREPRKNADTIIYMPQTNLKQPKLLRWSMMVALSLIILVLISLSGVVSNSGRSFAQDVAAREKQNFSPSASSGPTNLFMLTGSGANLAFGDYVSNSTTLNTSYRFFIEVPQGLPRLAVEIFDADVGRGGANEDDAGRDRARGGFDTSVTYTLIRPDGTTAATLSCDDATCTDNAWQAILDSTTAQNTAAGHWELRVNMSSSVTGGDDINAIGVRAHDGTSGAGGTELNIYFDSFNALGVNPPASGTQSRSYAMYPYITSGATFSKNDFDFDSDSGNVGSIALTSRTGEFTQNLASASMSADNVWRRDAVTGWTSDLAAIDYGIWNANVTISSYLVGGTPNGNYADLYFSNYQAAVNPPTSNPATNAFRVYLPTDAGTAPAKPYLTQLMSHVSGPKTPVVGQTSVFAIFVHMNNPTSRAITFSTPTNIITSNVPVGVGVTYAGNSSVNQGSIVSQPAIGGTGNVTWNPGTVAAGARATLSYRVSVTPPSTARIPTTGTPASGNGTRAQYVDETGNTTQTRATYLFGPLAELAVTPGIITAAPALISGRVTDDNGAPLGGVTVNLSGGKGTRTITDSNGNYRFENVETEGFYTVTPERANYSFTPASLSFSLLADKTDAGFIANASAQAINPLDSRDIFVRQQYLDFLAREPDQNGWLYWTDEISRCGFDADCTRQRRIDVSAAFFMSDEFQQGGNFIYRIYKGGLGRPLTYAEFSADRNLVVGSKQLESSKAAFADAFVGRAEFVRKYGAAKTADSFVDALVQNIRQSSGVDLSGQRGALLNSYNAGASLNESRSQALRKAIDDASFMQAEYNRSFVRMQYFGYLKRDPEQSGLDFWLDVLNSREPNNYRGMVCSFLTSAEYQQRFSTVLTHSNAECGR